jgi:hypothetical protein
MGWFEYVIVGKMGFVMDRILFPFEPSLDVQDKILDQWPGCSSYLRKCSEYK